MRTHLALKAAADFLRDKNEYLAAEVARRTKQISVVQDVTERVAAPNGLRC